MLNGLSPACPIAFPQRVALFVPGFSPSILKEAFESFNNKNDDALCNTSLWILFRNAFFFPEIFALIWVSSFWR